jgi:hypothetical protein
LSTAPPKTRVGARRSFEEGMAAIVSYRPEVDGRILLAGVLAVYFLVVAIPHLVWGADVWRFLGVPTGPSPFFDTRNLTAALDCRRLGYDPLRHSPCDPWGRPLNYPRIWLVLRWLGLTQAHTDALAVVLVALFIGSIFLLTGRLTLGSGIVMAVAVCSPSVMFAVERGNMDIVVFAVLVAAVLVWRASPWAEIASPLIVLFAGMLKIYPVFALPAFVFVRRHRAALVATACVIGFGVYALVTLGDIAANARIAPQGDYHAFGARILPAAVYHRFVPERWKGGAATKQLLALVPVLVAAPFVWIAGRRRLPADDPDVASWRRLAFWISALVFLGTFAVGNNFDYRLVFLLLALPQLIEWTRAERDPRRRLGAVTLFAVLVLLWVSALSVQLDLWDEVATWGVVLLFGVLIAASLPTVGELVAVFRVREPAGSRIVRPRNPPYPR